MKIIRADHLGMCFGVRDAIALARRQAESGPLTILGELVHNRTVVESLRKQGVQFESRLESVHTPTVMITAHGASDKAIDAVRQKGLNVLEATCPLVHHAHDALRNLVRNGCFPVVIGRRDHVEVRGMTEDLEEFAVVLSEEEIERLPDRPRFGVVAQTTQPIEKVRELAGLIRRRFPNSEVHFRDTVCQPTKQRQAAAVDLAGRCDVVVVVGGRNSNNTHELVRTCRRYCERVHHVQTAQDLRPEWLEQAGTIGLTAGTSTPDITINAVEYRLRELAEKMAAPQSVEQPCL